MVVLAREGVQLAVIFLLFSNRDCGMLRMFTNRETMDDKAGKRLPMFSVAPISVTTEAAGKPVKFSRLRG